MSAATRSQPAQKTKRSAAAPPGSPVASAGGSSGGPAGGIAISSTARDLEGGDKAQSRSRDATWHAPNNAAGRRSLTATLARRCEARSRLMLRLPPSADQRTGAEMLRLMSTARIVTELAPSVISSRGTLQSICQSLMWSMSPSVTLKSSSATPLPPRLSRQRTTQTARLSWAVP